MISTKLIRSSHRLAPHDQGGVLTMGNFDGVHLGHQQLVKAVVEKARSLNVPALVVTFEPHPFEYFNRAAPTVPRLTRLREKFKALSRLGVDDVIILPFNQSLASISASDFLEKIVYSQLKPKHIIIGDDFHFGYQRQGNLQLLQQVSGQYGFTVQALPTVLHQGQRVSSTRVRQALAAGDLLLAKELLGRFYSMQGRISTGDQRGRQFGFPTANIFLHRRLTPVKGVYQVLVHGVADQPLPGVANVGVRPTVDGTKTLLEVHLLDFNQDIYGRYVEVEFLEKWRDEVSFSNIDSLKEQLAKDVAASREFFKLF